MSFEEYQGIFMMYPPSQSYKTYHDTSSDDASIHGEDEAFLEKAEPSKKLTGRFMWLRRLSYCFLNASVISCIISAITATLVLVLLLVSTKGHPISAIKQTAMSTFSSHKEPVPLHGHGPHTSHPAPSASQISQCGSSPAEARALGCVFDVMSFAFTPPACYDHETSQKYLERNGPWIFYLDHNATQPLEFDTLSDHEVVWTEHSYHIVHCLYAWERGHMAMNQGKGTLIPGEMGSIDHTLHCVDLLDDVGEAAAPAKKVNAIAYLVYDGCRELE